MSIALLGKANKFLQSLRQSLPLDARAGDPCHALHLQVPPRWLGPQLRNELERRAAVLGAACTLQSPRKMFENGAEPHSRWTNRDCSQRRGPGLCIFGKLPRWLTCATGSRTTALLSCGPKELHGWFHSHPALASPVPAQPCGKSSLPTNGSIWNESCCYEPATRVPPPKWWPSFPPALWVQVLDFSFPPSLNALRFGFSCWGLKLCPAAQMTWQWSKVPPGLSALPQPAHCPLSSSLALYSNLLSLNPSAQALNPPLPEAALGKTTNDPRSAQTGSPFFSPFLLAWSAAEDTAGPSFLKPLPHPGLGHLLLLPL